MDTKTQHVITISDADWEGLQAAAKGTGRKPNEIVASLIRNYLRRISSDVGVRYLDDAGNVREKLLTHEDIYSKRIVDTIPMDQTEWTLFIRKNHDCFEEAVSALFFYDELSLLSYPDFYHSIEDGLVNPKTSELLERCGFRKDVPIDRYSRAVKEFLRWLVDHKRAEKIMKNKSRVIKGLRRKALR